MSGIKFSNTTPPAPGGQSLVTFQADGQGNISAAYTPGAGGGAVVLLEKHTASASATLDFTTAITGTYDDYFFEVINLIPTAGASDLQMLVSTNGGSTYDTSANYYDFIWGVPNTGSNATTQDNGATLFRLFTSLDNTVLNGGFSGRINMVNPLSASIRKNFHWQGIGNQSGAVYMVTGAGVWVSATAVNAIRFKFNGTTIAQGTIRCYGLATS